MKPENKMLSAEKNGIRLSHVKKSFCNCTVFRDLSLTIAGRGVTALMGESGCGKTTLCSLLLGLIEPDGGTIDNPYRQISCAFQDPRLLPHLTAEENVVFVLSGQPRKSKLQTARAILSDLGLAEALQKYPSELSGGMRQRVSLARAFAAPHDFLILDEPFRGLDSGNRQTVFQKIRLFAETRPILLVTHDEDEAVLLDAKIVRL